MKRIVYSMMMVSALALTSSMASAGHYKNHKLSHLQVQAIQQGLHDAGYYDDAPVDGLWGPVTTKAMSSFQYNKGLEPTGYPDKKTLEKLGVNMPIRGQDITKNDQ
ncbi:MAG: hypothetical protein JWO78_324 [Micavibrio sp.]|nr:hypothetical protein [Micavibrio sp.]